MRRTRSTHRGIRNRLSRAGTARKHPDALLERLESRQLLATVNWDGGPSGTGTDWSDPVNWAGDVLPGATDDALIGSFAGPAIQITGTANVRSVNTGKSLTIAGTLNVSDASIFSAPVVLSGTLGGTGDCTFASILTWTGGVMSGPATAGGPVGRVIINGSGSLVISGTTHDLNRTLENNGTTTWTAGPIRMSGGTFNNNSAFTASASGSGGAGLQSFGSAGVNAFNNIGTFTKLGGGEASFSVLAAGVAFNSLGTIVLQEGMLTLAGGGSMSTPLTVNPSAAFTLGDSYTFTGNGSINGSGAVHFTGGTHSLPAGRFNPTGPVHFTSGTITISTPFTPSVLGPIGGTVTFAAALNWSGDLSITGTASFAVAQTFSSLTLSGTLTGAGDITIPGAINWTAGTMAGSGKTHSLAGGTITLSSVGAKILSRILNSGGAATWTGGDFAFAGGTFNNNGTFTANSSATLLSYGNSGANTFASNGTFTKLGTGETRFTTNVTGVAFNNVATVTVSAGQLTLGGGGSASAAFNVGALGTLAFAGNYSFTASGSIAGAGEVKFTGGTINIPAGLFNPTGPVNFNGGTVTINNSFTPASLGSIGGTVTFAATLNYSSAISITGSASFSQPQTFTSLTLSGTLTGAGDVTIAAGGSLTWNSGAMSGAGKTIIPTGAALTITTGATHTLSRQILSSGATTWNGGAIAMNGGTFTNNGSFLADAPTTLQAYGSGGINVFTNSGMFTKQNAGDCLIFAAPATLPFNNSGIVSILGGTLALGGGSTGTVINVASGSVLTFTGTFTYSAGGGISGSGTVNFNGGTHTFSAGQFSTTGPLNFNGGTVTINSAFSSTALGPIAGTVFINANVSFQNVSLSGTLGGSGDVTVTSSMTWTGGTLTGTGKLTIPVGATMTLSTGAHTLSRRIDIAGNASWIGGDIAFASGTINVLTGASFTINSNAAMQATGSGSGNALSNAGTVVKLGLGDAQFIPGAAAVVFNNSGVITAQEGTLSIGGGGTSSGSIAAPLGGTLVFSGSYTYTSGSVSGAGTITFSAGTHSITTAAFNASGQVNFAGGTVSIGNAFSPASLGPIAGVVTFNATVNYSQALTITGSAGFGAAQNFAGLTLSGELTGAGDVTISGGAGLSWTGGTMSGTGRTLVSSGSSLSMSGTAHTLSRTLDVSGPATWTDGDLAMRGGSLYIRSGATLSAGTSGTLSVTGVEGTNTWNVQGTLTKIGTGTLRLVSGTNSAGLLSSGLISVQEGTLEISGGGTSSGSMQAQLGATLSFGGSLTYTGGSISGAGTIVFTAGTHNLAAAAFNPTGTLNLTGGTITFGNALSLLALGPIGATVVFNSLLGYTGDLVITGSASFALAQTFSNLTLSGTLGGAGNITVGDELIWSAGSMTGSGRTIIPVNADLTISGAAHTLSRTIDISGEALWSAGDLTMSAGAINILAGAALVVDLTGTANLSGSEGLNVLSNSGTLTKRGSGSLNLTTAAPGVQLTNPGTIIVQAGGLSLGGGGSSAGSLSISTGATLTFAAAFNYVGGGPITGGGSLSFNGGTHSIPGGQLAVTGAVNFVSGSITVSGSFAPSSLGPIGASVIFQSALGYAGSITITGIASFASAQTFSAMTLSGTLTGAGNVSVTGALAWTGGSMTGLGYTIVNPGGSMSLSGSTHSLSRVLRLSGVGNWTAGDLTFNGGVLEIAQGGVLTVSTTGTIAMTGASGSNSLVVDGSLVKTGSGVLSFVAPGTGVDFYNQGTLHVQAGSVNLASVGNLNAYTLTGGIWIVENAGFLNFPSGSSIYTNHATIRLNGINSSFGALIPLSTNAGSLTLADGRLATFAPLGNLFTNLGTLIKSGSGAATIAFPITFSNSGNVTVQGGTLTIAGPVSQVNGSTLTGGQWSVSGGGILVIPNVNIATSHAAIWLSGATSRFDAVAGLRVNMGSLTITGGKTFAPATFTNLGKLTIGPGSTMTVAGNFENSFYAMNHGGVLAAAGGGNSTGTFWLFSGGQLSLNGAHTLTTTATVIGAGNLAVTGGSTAFNAPVTLQGMLSISTGTATFATDVSFTSAVNTGTLNLGSNRLNLWGVYTQGAAGVLSIRIDSATQFGRITAGGGITLSGSLNVSWGFGYAPPVGTAFTFISGSGRVGMFGTTNIASLSGRITELQYQPMSVTLVINPA